MFLMDGFHMPSPGAPEMAEFRADLPGGNDTILNWQMFHKPRDARYMGLFVMGAGGGGEAGAGGPDGSARFGGGAGSFGGYALLHGPAALFPDLLYLRVGGGGPGGVGSNAVGLGANGTDGGLSLVSLAPSNDTGNTTGGTIMNIGGGRSGKSGGGSGLSANSFGSFLLLPAPTATLGQTAGAGGTGAGTNAGLPAWPLGQGAPGGGTIATAGTFNPGGSCLGAPAADPSKIADVIGGQTDGADGGHGHGDWRHMKWRGGAGGASSALGKGGNGGDGAMSCGGGGGGAGVTGGNGGRGGDGLIRIFWW